MGAAWTEEVGFDIDIGRWVSYLGDTTLRGESMAGQEGGERVLYFHQGQKQCVHPCAFGPKSPHKGGKQICTRDPR